MKPRRNLVALTGLGLGLVAVVGYFALVSQHRSSLRPLLDFPWLNLLLLAIGLFLSYRGIRGAYDKPPRLRGRLLAPLLAGFNVAAAGVFCFFLFWFSYDLPAAPNAPAMGAMAPDFSLPDQAGRVVELASRRGHNTVLVFYRGFW